MPEPVREPSEQVLRSPSSSQTAFTPERTITGVMSSCDTNRPTPTRTLLDHKFAESVSLSSTAPVDFPLPGTALAFGFDLLGSRARRKEESRASSGDVQGVEDTSKPQFAEIQLSTCPQQTVQHVDNSVEQDTTPAPPPSTG